MQSKKINEINGFESFFGYAIYENGDVVSHKHNKPKIIKGSIDSNGYRYIDIKDTNGKRKCPKIHRLVGLAFIDNPKGKPQINHIDGIKLNNDLSNLEWATNSENQIHAYANGLQKPPKGKSNYQWSGDHKNCKSVNQYDLQGNFIATHKSLAIAGRSINRSQNRISECCNGQWEKAYGFKWEFVK